MGQSLSGLRAFLAQLGTRRLMLMGGVALALLAALAAVAMRGTTTDMGFLYTDLDPAAAQAITEKLAAQNIPFQLSADGTSVMAPQDKLAELRMTMAGDRLGGKVGYDVLDAEEPFGVSASRAKMNETRAVEGELGRSIETLDTVVKARVHIVMPERAMFAAETRKATAAITLKTRGRLSGESVQAIRYLVAASVPELSAESVTIIDQNGTLLARAGEAGDANSSQADERQIAVEARLRSQIEAMLEPIVGVGKVRAEVAAVISRDQIREDSNIFDPDKQVIAHQITVESADQNDEGSAAQRGASVGAQLPDSAGQGGAGGNSRKSAKRDNSEDTTFDNSAVRTVTMRGTGKISRLTVAVMIDGGAKGIPAPQLRKLTRLVENAVGFESDRGDSVVVEPMVFAAADALAGEKPGLLSMVSMDQVFGLLKLIIVAVVGLVALRMLQPRVNAGNADDQLLLPPTEAEQEDLAERAAAGDENAVQQLLEIRERGGDVALLDQEIALAQIDGRIKLSALKRIGDAVATSPAESASVIRQWMNA
jgi:flagellar M-ring protein FliF